MSVTLSRSTTVSNSILSFPSLPLDVSQALINRVQNRYSPLSSNKHPHAKGNTKTNAHAFSRSSPYTPTAAARSCSIAASPAPASSPSPASPCRASAPSSIGAAASTEAACAAPAASASYASPHTNARTAGRSTGHGVDRPPPRCPAPRTTTRHSTPHRSTATLTSDWRLCLVGVWKEFSENCSFTTIHNTVRGIRDWRGRRGDR